MKYIGIALMWLGYAGAVAALAFSPKAEFGGVVAVAVIVGISLAIASASVAHSKG